MILAPRWYQSRAIVEIRAEWSAGARSVVYQSPTGSGKTVTVAEMFRRAHARGSRCIVAAHRDELVGQLAGALKVAEVPHGRVVAGQRTDDARILVASIPTLARRMGEVLELMGGRLDLLALDECHHAVAKTWAGISHAALDAGARLLGMTATPERSDGKGLGDIFDAMVVGPSVRDLTREGFLSPYEILYPDWEQSDPDWMKRKRRVVGDPVALYLQHVHPHTCLVYCASRRHARRVLDLYLARGVRAQYVGGDTPKDERRAALREFKAGRLPVIVSVDLFGEGLDCPGLVAVQMLRPTGSVGLYLQMAGRALRVEARKRRAIIVDQVGNSLVHGRPCDDRSWTLDPTKEASENLTRKAEDETLPLRVCDFCFSYYRPSLPRCTHCGHVATVAGRVPGQDASADLLHLTMEQVQEAWDEVRETRERWYQEKRAEGLEALVVLAIDRGYKRGWAAMRHAVRNDIPKEARGELFREENRIRKRLEGAR